MTSAENTNSIGASFVLNSPSAARWFVLNVIVCPATSPVAGEMKALNTTPAGSVSVKTTL